MHVSVAFCTVTHVLVFFWSCFILEPRSLRPIFLETARADSLISMPPQMEDAIFGVNSDFYIREVSTALVFLDVFAHSEQTAKPEVVYCNFILSRLTSCHS